MMKCRWPYGLLLDPHRHQHIKRRRLVVFAKQSRRGGIGEMDLDRIALDLPQNVEQVTRIEADLETLRAIIGGHFLGRGAVLGRGYRQGHAAAVERPLSRPASARVQWVRRDRRPPRTRAGRSSAVCRWRSE